MRREFTKGIRALAFQRANGKCEGKNCGARLSIGKFAYDHDNPDGLTGEPTLENCVVLCNVCHGIKTKRDIANIARAKRREAKHIGAKRSPYRPIQSAGFAKRDKRPKPLTKVMARRQIYTDYVESQYVEEGHDVI